MASYQFDIQALNDIVVDYGGAGGHTFTINALNAWAVLLGGTGGHTFNINALNEIVGLLAGAGAPFTKSIDALNSISAALGGASNYRFDIDALNAIADLPVFGVAAPTLTLTSGAADNQPDFLISGDLLVDDVVTARAYSDAGLTTLVDTGQGTVTVAGSLTISNQLGPLSDAAYWYNAVTDRAGHSTSLPSNTENNTIDATAPTLSSPTGVKTGVTTASLSVSTNEGNGTVFWVVDTGGTPSAAQVKQGKGSGGSAANGDADSQAASTTGVQTISGGATGLTGSTTYKAYYMQEDAVGNQSTVSASASFTTDAANKRNVIFVMRAR